MIDLTPLLSEIHRACADAGLARLDLIGSAARHDFTPESDVDVLVTFAGNQDVRLRRSRLKANLEVIFGRRVDVVVENLVKDPFFKRAVALHRIPIYSVNETPGPASPELGTPTEGAQDGRDVPDRQGDR